MKLSAFTGTLVALYAKFLGDIYPPVMRITQQAANEDLPNEIPSFNDLIAMRASNVIDEQFLSETGPQTGMSPRFYDLFTQLNQQKLQGLEYIALQKRGVIGLEYCKQQLQRLRYTDADIENLFALFEYFPNVPDLIRFAVREVYSPEIAEKFGQFEDFPEDFVKAAAKVGLSEEQARNYWAAHWELPSLAQGYEMFHRGVISEEDLAKLMRAQDVMPYWRDKLQKISYNPLTRVDVRRMYSMGVLTRDEVYRSYLDGGYSPENAERLTEFTVRYEDTEYDGITRANLIAAYQDKLISRAELQEMLVGLNYSDRAVAFWLERADYELTLNEIKASAQELSDQYQMGLIDLPTVRNALNALDVPASFVESIIDKLIRKQAVRSKLPDKKDLVAWLASGAIDDKTFTVMMRGLGYRDDAIQAYLANSLLSGGAETRKYLPLSTYKSWVTSKIMSEEEFLSILDAQGYSSKDAQRVLAELE